jgi:hypothetical protein
VDNPARNLAAVYAVCGTEVLEEKQEELLGAVLLLEYLRH